MENNSGKASGRRITFNLFDIVIIVIVIALVAGFAFFQSRGKSSGNSVGTETVQYQVEIVNLTEDTESLIHEGDEITDKVKKNGMGTVVASEFYPMKKDAVDRATGNTVYSDVPGMYAARVTIEAKCSDTGASLVTEGGYEVRAGREVSIIGPGDSGGGYIVNVMRGEDDE